MSKSMVIISLILHWCKSIRSILPKLLIYQIQLRGRKWWREITVSSSAWGVSCYICSNVVFSLVRAIDTSSWYILRRCRICARYMNGHMVGWPWLSLIIILATLLTTQKNHWGKHDLTVGNDIYLLCLCIRFYISYFKMFI